MMEYEWYLVKDAIDDYRTGDELVASKKTLMSHNLWDYGRDTMDEEAVNKLYMENC